MPASIDERRPIEAVALHDISLLISSEIIDDSEYPVGSAFVLYLASGFESKITLDKIWGIAEPHLLHLWIEETDDGGPIIDSHVTYSGSYTVWWIEQN